MARRRMVGLESIKTSLRDWGPCNHPFRRRDRKARALEARDRARDEIVKIDKEMLREVRRKIRLVLDKH